MKSIQLMLSLKIIRQGEQYPDLENMGSIVVHKYILRVIFPSCKLSNFKNVLSNKVNVYSVLASQRHHI